MRSNREIGPRGTAARIAAGAAVIVLALVTGGFTAWNAGFGLVALPLVSMIVLGRSSSEFSPLALVAVLVVAVSFVTPVTEGSVLIWLGVSFLLSSVMGVSGCEMVAIPNLLTGRRYRLPCFLFVAIDRAD